VSAFRVERFRAGLAADFDRVHSDTNDAGWCRCVAWWVPTWDGWGERSAGENAALRAELCDRGEYDGLLAYDGDEPVGWCQVGRRDRLNKLVRQLGLEPSAATWAVSCFLVAPYARGRGVARALLGASVETARAEGGARLEGYPRIAVGEPGDLWTGPESLFLRAGFTPIGDVPPRRVYALRLGS
jgi:GNAT superfamily N-acetyltransferase